MFGYHLYQRTVHIIGINFYSKSIRTAETTEIRGIILTLRLLNDAEFVLGVVEVVIIGPFGDDRSSIGIKKN